VTEPKSVRARFLGALAVDPRSATSHRLCATCIEVLPVDRAAISLRVGKAGLEALSASDDFAARIEGIQVIVGEGPGPDAIKRGGPVVISDLATLELRRWPAFGAALNGFAVGAMFAFPLQVGAIQLGVLDLFRDSLRPLSNGETAEMLHVADLVTTVLLSQWSDGQVSGAERELGSSLAAGAASREVHQATGMISVQLGVPVAEAYLRLRARAFADGRLLNELAHEVVQRRLRFDPDGDGSASRQKS
jgi:hypothetical protein